MISNFGEVLSIRRNKILKQKNNHKGYKSIILSKDGETRSYLIHRLVAIAFIHNDDESKNQVNHIDGNKTNNCVNNLEWCTNSYNTWHAINVLNNGHYEHNDNGQSKEVILLNTGEKFKSLCEAERITGINRKSIRRSCNNECSYTKDPRTGEKVTWAFLDDI